MSQVKELSASTPSLFLHSEHGAFVVNVPRITVMGKDIVPVEPKPDSLQAFLQASEFGMPVLQAGDLVFGSIEYRICNDASRYATSGRRVWCPRCDIGVMLSLCCLCAQMDKPESS